MLALYLVIAIGVIYPAVGVLLYKLSGSKEGLADILNEL